MEDATLTSSFGGVGIGDSGGWRTWLGRRVLLLELLRAGNLPPGFPLPKPLPSALYVLPAVLEAMVKGIGVTNGTAVSMAWFDGGAGGGWVENVPAGGVYTSGSVVRSRSGRWLGR